MLIVVSNFKPSLGLCIMCPALHSRLPSDENVPDRVTQSAYLFIVDTAVVKTRTLDSISGPL